MRIAMAYQPVDIDNVTDVWLQVCGSCDAGLNQNCTCKEGDYRPVMMSLVKEVEHLRAKVAELSGASPAQKAKVILFKKSGKYYTEEEWRIPAARSIAPADMLYSPDFRRIDNGAVLIPTQEPWGYPHLFPSESQ